MRVGSNTVNECSFPSILSPGATPRKHNKHKDVRRPSHTSVTSRTGHGTQTPGLFFLALGVFRGGSVFGRRRLGLRSLRLALRRGRGSRTVSARSTGTMGFLGVIGNVPAGTFELHGRC